METLPRYQRASRLIRERFCVFVRHLSRSYDKNVIVLFEIGKGDDKRQLGVVVSSFGLSF